MSQAECCIHVASDAVLLWMQAGALVPSVEKSVEFREEDAAAAVEAFSAAVAQAAASGVKKLHVRVAACWLDWHVIPWAGSYVSEPVLLEKVRADLEADGLQAHALSLYPRSYGRPLIVGGLRAGFTSCLAGLPASMEVSVASVSEAAFSALKDDIPDESYGLMVVEGGHATFIAVERAGWRHVSVHRFESEQGTLAPEIAWRRIGLKFPHLANLSKVHVLVLGESLQSGHFPDSVSLQRHVLTGNFQAGLGVALWQKKPLFTWLERKKGIASSGTLLLLGAIMLVLLSTLFLVRELGELERLKEDYANAAVRALPRSAAPLLTPDEVRNLTARIRSVNGAVSLLNVPVENLLQAVRPDSRARVVLLSVQVQPDGGQKIVVKAQSESDEAMVDYVKMLSKRKPLISALLVSHELTTVSGKQVYLFMVEAAWE